MLSHTCLQVKSRVAVLNQRHPERTIWKESAICTKTWNSSVLQLIDVSLRLHFAHGEHPLYVFVCCWSFLGMRSSTGVCTLARMRQP